MIGKNNPLNIRSTSARWKGKTGSTRGFCDFDSVESCIRVGLYLLERTYPKRGIKTIHDIIYTFAPPSDGNSSAVYSLFVCRKAGINPDDIFCDLMFGTKYKVLAAMCQMESNYILPYVIFDKVYYSFKYEE